MNESTEIVLQTQHAIMPAMDVNMAVARYDMMKQFVSSCLVKGQDYGLIPGTNKDTLFKSGAEKLMSMFGLTPSFEAVEIVQDWTGKDHGEPFLYYWFKCKLHRGDLLVGEGEGSCNSWESKYRWRWVPENEMGNISTEGLLMKDSSISEWKFAVEKAETTGQYGKPVEYWNKFEEARGNGTLEISQQAFKSGKMGQRYTIPAKAYRLPNPDVASVANTILKMAQKRALVAATLIATNASDYFTQDLEDMEIGASYTVVAPQPEKPAKQLAPIEPELVPMDDIVEVPVEAPSAPTIDLNPYIALGTGRTDYEFSEGAGNLMLDLRASDAKAKPEMSIRAYGYLTGLVTSTLRITGTSPEWKKYGPLLWATIWKREVNKNHRPGEECSVLIDWLNPDSPVYNLDVANCIIEIWDAVKALHDEINLWVPEHGLKEQE